MDFSAASLFASFVVSGVGYGFFTYGRKQQRWPQLIGGLIMMIEPYFGGGAVTTWSVGAVLAAGMVLAVRMGW